ncbi:MAG TPA: nucleotidyltransferase domain-containing protein [Opitutus sp.]|nr:nucleotidyltransferase domain-containing protein [Opitutus sp.]
MLTLFESLQRWLQETDDVRVAAVFGSHARALTGEGQPADPHSDVDLEIATTRPEKYRRRDWTAALADQQIHAYADRPVFGGVQKVTALFSGGEADFVIIPYRRLWLGRMAFALRLHKRVKSIERGLGEFALVMSFGQVVLKGGPGWQRFYTRAVAEVPLKHLTDEEAISISEGAYVDAASVLQKLARGEYVAAQRWLNRSVIEANFRLMHELRYRRKQVSYPDGRRVEQLLDGEDLAAVRFEVSLTKESLHAATLRAVAGTRRLLTELTGRAPTWPEL